MKLIIAAHRSQGVVFEGKPEYIHQDAYLDPSGGLTISKGVVISTRVIILTHDWSFLKREDVSTKEYDAFRPVKIAENAFIGAGAIVLPGSEIGSNSIIGAGAVIKGKVDKNNIMAGNPAKCVGKTTQ